MIYLAPILQWLIAKLSVQGQRLTFHQHVPASGSPSRYVTSRQPLRVVNRGHFVLYGAWPLPCHVIRGHSDRLICVLQNNRSLGSEIHPSAPKTFKSIVARSCQMTTLRPHGASTGSTLWLSATQALQLLSRCGDGMLMPPSKDLV